MASHLIALAAARPNHRTAISNCSNPRWVQVQFDSQIVYFDYSVQLCVENLSWDIRLFVWRKFHFFCGTAVSCIGITQTTAFSCYRLLFVYMQAGVFHAIEEDTTQHGCVRVLL